MAVLSQRFRQTPEYGGFASFVDTCLEFDPSLATPVRFLWRGYRQYAREYGFPDIDAGLFVQYCANEPRMRLREFPEARGHIRSVVNGVCVKGTLPSR